MAQSNDDEAVPAKKSRKPLIFLALLLLAAAGGGGAWYYMTQMPHAQQAPKPAPAKPPVFVSLDTFTINLLPDVEPQFLQVDITLQFADEEDAQIIKTHMPEVRNRLLMLLTTKKSTEINTLEGKKQLGSDISSALNQPYTAGQPFKKVIGVFFTSFVIQ